MYKANGHTSTVGINPSLSNPWTSKSGKTWRFWKMADSKKQGFSKSPIININWNYVKIDKWDFLEANYSNWPVFYPQYLLILQLLNPLSVYSHAISLPKYSKDESMIEVWIFKEIEIILTYHPRLCNRRWSSMCFSISIRWHII